MERGAKDYFVHLRRPEAGQVCVTLTKQGIDITEESRGKEARKTSVPIEQVLGSHVIEVTTRVKTKDRGKSQEPARENDDDFDLVNSLKLTKKEKFGSKLGLFDDILRENDGIYCLGLDFFTIRKQGRSKTNNFRIHNLVLKFKDLETNDASSFDKVKRWADEIQQHLEIRRRQIHSDFRLDRRKRCLIFLNPNSGKGSAMKIFRTRIEPILKMAMMPFDLVITKRQGHARDMIVTEDLDRWSCIIVVSGDGLLFEVFQGLMQRPDWRKCLNTIPLTIIASGSGNGLARTLCHEAGRSFHKNGVVGSTLAVVNGQSKPMDLMFVETKSGFKSYSFLSVGLGFLSDVDIESEKLRFMGEPRFAFYSLYKLATLKKYKAIVFYKKALCFSSGNQDKVRFTVNSSNDQLKIPDIKEENFDKADPTSNGFNIPNIVEDEFIDVSSSDNDLKIQNTDEDSIGPRSSGNQLKIPNAGDGIEFGRQITELSLASRSFHDLEYPKGDDGRVKKASGVFLPLFSEDLSDVDGWTRTEGDFLIIYAVNVAFIGSKLKIAPEAKINDGLIWLMLVRNDVSKGTLVKIISAMESGSHVNYPGVEMIPVTAFRIEPRDIPEDSGNLTVDGEKLPKMEPIHVQIVPSMAKCIS